MKEAVLALFDATNRRDLDALRAIFAPEFLLDGRATTFDAYAAGMPAFFAAFPDACGQVQETIVQGDRVSARWITTARHAGPYAGVEATGRRVTWSGMTSYRLAAGRVVEMWQSADVLSLLQQIGAVRGPAARPSAPPVATGLVSFEVKSQVEP